jgi:hypothetical protein
MQTDPAKVAASLRSYSALGKEVLENGQHYADAALPEAALRIAAALNLFAEFNDQTACQQDA